MNTRKMRTVAFVLAAGLTGSAQAGVAYTFTDLSTLGGANSHAYAINNAGQIVGFSDITGETATHATLWDGNTITDLGHLGGNYSLAYDINDSGQIVGSSNTTANAATHATLWNSGNITDLDPWVGSGGSTAYAINSSGQIVGKSSYANSTPSQATLWVGNTKTNLGSFAPGTYSSAFDLNDSGQIVGVGSSIYGINQPLFWADGAASGSTRLGYLAGGYAGEAYAINNVGQIAGYTQDAHGFKVATIWEESDVINLHPEGGGKATSINNIGQVVGNTNRVSLWSNGEIIDLNIFLDPELVSAGWVLSDAEDINDSGWIVGKAYNNNTGQFHAYLLTPVPEPETYALMLAGLGLVGAVARRKKQSES